MEEESPLVRRAKSAILMFIFVAVVIFPLFQERKEFFEDRVGDPEVQLLPNTEKMQITLFPTKGQYGTGFYSILRDPQNATRFKVLTGNVHGAIAQGALTVTSEGYNRLIIQGHDVEASGYLEGYLTLAKLKQFQSYLKQVVLRSVFEDKKLLNTLENYYQQIFTDLIKKTNGSSDAYEQAIYRSLKRLEGIVRGFNEHVSPSAQIDVTDLFMVNSLHEMITLSSQKFTNKTIQVAGSAEHASFLFAQNFGSTYIMKLSSQYIQHVHTMYTAIPTTYRLSKYYYHTAGKTDDESNAFNREISIVSYPGMIIGMDSFNAIKSSIMYTVNPLNSMVKKAQDGAEFPFMESNEVPFFLTLAAASTIAKNGKEMTELITQHKGDKLGYYSVTVVDVTLLRSANFDSTAKDVVLLLEKAQNHVETEDITQKLISNKLYVSDGVAVHEIVRQQSQLERNSLNGVFDHEQFASGAKSAYTLSGLALATKSSFNQDLIGAAVNQSFFSVKLNYVEEGLTTRL
jgi:hypothetical protein